MGKRDKSIEDDSALWARVAETATPLQDKKRTKSRIPKGAVFPEQGRLPSPTQKLEPSSKKPSKNTILPGASSIAIAAKPVPKVAVKKSAPPTTGLDRQTARKLDKGRLGVQARLDLHGMRQREAHGALRKFLHWARAKDYRHVLIITGKGSLRDEGTSFYEEEARGVLRQAVPHWLTRGDLAPLIVSISEAPRRLGGEGALYVRLRRGR